MGFLTTRTQCNVWADGKLPYTIDTTTFQPNSEGRAALDQAIRYWNDAGLGLQLVSRSDEEDYAEFICGDECYTTCSGRLGGRQTIRCNMSSPGFSWGDIVHEISLAAGCEQEQKRNDAGKSITVHWSNVQAGQERNLESIQGVVTTVPFQYDSMMMCAPTAFAKIVNGKPATTVIRNDCETYSTQRTHLTPSDRQTINARYPIVKPQSPNTANTMQIVSWRKTTHENCVELPFRSFIAPAPRVALGLQSFDICGEATARVKINQDGITTTSVSSAVRMQSWANSRIWSISAGWIPIRSCSTQIGTWSTSEVRKWNEVEKETFGYISFETPFASTPRVLVVLNAFDVSKDANMRIVVEARDVSNTGFQVRVGTWGDSVLFMAGVMWIATTEPENTLSMGTWSTASVRPWNQPRHETSGPVAFPSEFSTVPQLLAGFSQIDLAKGASYRATCLPKDITKSGFTAQGSTWADSTLYSAKVAWAAIDL